MVSNSASHTGCQQHTHLDLTHATGKLAPVQAAKACLHSSIYVNGSSDGVTPTISHHLTRVQHRHPAKASRKAARIGRWAAGRSGTRAPGPAGASPRRAHAPGHPCPAARALGRGRAASCPCAPASDQELARMRFLMPTAMAVSPNRRDATIAAKPGGGDRRAREFGRQSRRCWPEFAPRSPQSTLRRRRGGWSCCRG